MRKPYRFLPKDEITQAANRILEGMKDTPAQPTWPFEANHVADYLDLGVEWTEIPKDLFGSVAGLLNVEERLILLNQELQSKSEGFQQSTLAHEIGHWVLHAYPPGEGPQDPDHPYICRLDWEGAEDPYYSQREFQAQYFATCLLMPEPVLIEVSRGLDPRVAFDQCQMAGRLGVTLPNIRHRLKDLDWIRPHPYERRFIIGEGYYNR